MMLELVIFLVVELVPVWLGDDVIMGDTHT